MARACDVHLDAHLFDVLIDFRVPTVDPMTYLGDMMFGKHQTDPLGGRQCGVSQARL